MSTTSAKPSVVRPPTAFDGADSRLALDEIAASMGFVVGKLGGAPEGSRVRLELTGPLSRTINVSVDQRAKVVDELDAEPTATISLDGLLFTRLAGGRTAVDHDAITYTGDQTVGRRIVEHLNYRDLASNFRRICGRLCFPNFLPRLSC